MDKDRCSQKASLIATNLAFQPGGTWSEAVGVANKSGNPAVQATYKAGHPVMPITVGTGAAEGQAKARC